MSNWLIFEDEVYTPAQLEAQIEENKRVRQEKRPDKRHSLSDIPHYGQVSSMPDPPQDSTYNHQLFHHLRQANQLVTQIETDPNLADSAATRIPVLGNIWKRIRQQAHQLILFYVNRLAANQNQINAQLIGSVNELTRQNIELQHKLVELQKKIDRLEQPHKEKGA